MKEAPVSRLRWSEFRSAEQVRKLLYEYQHVEIQLPADFHHVLFCRFQPRAEMAGQEQLDVAGGAEILETVGGVKGLRDLVVLKAVVTETRATVRLVSPVPLIILRLPEALSPRE